MNVEKSLWNNSAHKEKSSVLTYRLLLYARLALGELDTICAGYIFVYKNK